MTEADLHEDSQENTSRIQSIHCFRNDHYKFAFVTKGDCMIYIGLSRNKKESVSFIKK